jgi:CO dehydrogenase/acetyl-CoA synthase beta subunit
MIEMASNRRITKVSRVFPWAYKYTSRGSSLAALVETTGRRVAHERANYCNEEIRFEIRTHIYYFSA